MFFFESFLSLPNFCLWLLWSKKLEAGTFFFCVNTDALLHQTPEQYWFTAILTHTYNTITPQRNHETGARIPFSVCLSIHVWMHISRVALHHLAVFCLPEREAQEFQILCRQVWYDQFFHFPNFSRNLKLLRFIVIIKWPGNTTEITD